MSNNFEQNVKEFLEAKSLTERINGVQKLQAMLNQNEAEFMKKSEILFSEKKLSNNVLEKFRNSAEFANSLKNKVLSETRKIVQAKDKIGSAAEISLSQLKHFTAKSFSLANESVKQQLDKQNQAQKLSQRQGMKL